MESLRSVCGDLWLGLCCYSWVTNPRAKYQVLLPSSVVHFGCSCSWCLCCWGCAGCPSVRQSLSQWNSEWVAHLHCRAGLVLGWGANTTANMQSSVCFLVILIWFVFFSLSKALNRCVWQFNRKSISFKCWSICYNVVCPSTRLILAPSPPLR